MVSAKPPALPIDIEHAARIYPDLELAAHDLGLLLRAYQDVDRFFRQNFLDLFTGPDHLAPPDDRAWAALLRLRDLADGGLITDPIIKLDFNTDRARLTCSMLSIIFKL